MTINVDLSLVNQKKVNLTVPNRVKKFGALKSLGGAGYNTPSLLGVASHSPYLHDDTEIVQ